MEEESELEALRRKRAQELQAQYEEQQRQAELRQQFEIQKRAILSQILTPEARSRLANIRAVKPEFAEQLEIQLMQLAQAGRISAKITDSQLKEILDRLQSRKREIKIRRI
ncbi:MAG: DNA-binding protein [Candidatus Hadarchaeum sp.]|uniref:DNA-binding protein n=1 Tax=Candidatus Hadarchaeum sp. TaxID=2883567 RepID=UPI003D11367C